jgi:hypothetical protein
MKRKEMQRQAVLEAEDRVRMTAERAEYADVAVGSPCPRCAAIARQEALDRARGVPPGSWAEETCWLCNDTGSVVTR